jgi:hypothetical protein
LIWYFKFCHIHCFFKVLFCSARERISETKLGEKYRRMSPELGLPDAFGPTGWFAFREGRDISFEGPIQ